MTRKLIVTLGVLALLPVGLIHADDAAVSAPAPVTSELHGGGAWQTDGKAALAAQRWSLDVQRGSDGSLRGHIAVAASPIVSAGNVEGKIDGQTVSGMISDDEGNALVRFEGTLTATGMAGKYTDRTGEVGAWVWDGPPPQ
jgi:hypothetical protein